MTSAIILSLLVVGNFIFYRWAFSGGMAETDRLTFSVCCLLVTGPLTLATWALIQRALASAKGTLEIAVEDRVYELGESISGVVRLETKVPLDVETLRIVFSAESERTTDAHQNRTTWQNEFDLSSNQHVPIGAYEYPFSFEIPAQRAAPVVSGVVGQLLTTAMRGRLYWSLRATCAVPGVDLVQSTRVRINDGGLF